MIGTYHVEHRRRGRLLSSFESKNLITSSHKDSVLTYFFLDMQQWIMSPYAGLINAGASIASSDTWSLHPGWTENQDYEIPSVGNLLDGSHRPACELLLNDGSFSYTDLTKNIFLQGYPQNTTQPTASATAISDASNQMSKTAFVFTASGSLDGCFLTNVSQKVIDVSNPYTGERPEAIYSISIFPNQIVFEPQDVLSFIYNLKIGG